MRIATTALASVSFLALMLPASPVVAQTEQQQVDAARQANPDGQDSQAAGAPEEAEIVVTGSRIPRANFDSAQPVVVLGAEQIEARGYTNLGEALSELPAFGVPGNSAVGGQAGAFGAGQSFIDFFGLGDQRTLTVVNGRRFVSSNTSSIFGVTGAGSQVDFNVIPTLIVDRVETVAVGGAPIYGSDAIAGTVNIITRRTFDGIRLDAQYGISERGDAREYRIGGLGGVKFAGDRGSLTFAGEYNKSSGLTGTDRPSAGLNRFFTSPVAGTATPPNLVLINDRRIPALSEFGAPMVSDFIPLSPAQAAGDFGGFQPSVVDAAGNPLVFNAAGELVRLDFGRRTGNLVNFDGGNGFSLPQNLLTETRRYLATAQAQFEVTSGVRLFAEGWYANSKGSQLRSQPVYNTALFDAAGTPDGNLIISIDNPFLSPAARSVIAANLATNPNRDAVNQDFFYLGRANTDIISGAGSSTVELYRFVGGIDGTFEIGGRELTFEVVGNYGRSTTQGSERVLVQQNFENALNAVRDASGNIVCAPGAQNAPVRTITATCSPINPFGQQISQAARDYVTANADPRAVNDQLVGTASVSGSLFDIWGGPVGFALGYEHRRETARFNPGVFYLGLADPADPNGPRTQFGRTIPVDPISGKFNTDEVFGELTIPIIGEDTGISFIRSFELNGAARYIDHSLAGGDLTWTAGATFQPIRDITFRGNFTRSVRAPAITELFNPTSQIFTTAEDPCDSRFRDGGPNPANRQANCSTAGLAGDFESNIVDFTSRGTLQGNIALENEKADAYTVGAILRPSFLRGFTLAVDFVDIKVKGAIETLDATQTLEACYDSPTFPTAICDQFTRDDNGQVTFIQTGFANAAQRDFRGVIAELAWTIRTPFLGASSSLNLAANYFYNDKLQVRVGQGDLTTIRGSIGNSKHRVTSNLTYRNQGFRAQVQAQYRGPALFDPDEEPDNRDPRGVGDSVFFNTSLAYEINDRFNVRFIVDNVLGQKPPFPAPGGGGLTTYFSGIRGRYFKFGTSVQF